MKRSASAVWQGNLKQGRGVLSSDSGVLKDTAYSFATRFETSPGTNPEELIAAAHAGCFSMAFSAELGKAGFTPDRVATTAGVSLDMINGNPTITRIHLEMTAKIPGIDQAKFEEISKAAKAGCPVSRLLTGAEITLSAKLES